jgi:cytochrome c556
MKIPIAISLTLLFAVSAASPADEPSSIVRYRQTVMKAMGAHMNAMSLIVKKHVSQRARLAVHAEAVRGLSDGLQELFPAGTDPDHVTTAATPAVWKRPAELMIAVRKLQQETATLVVAAKAGDAKLAESQFEKVSAACNECHHQFRTQDSQ